MPLFFNEMGVSSIEIGVAAFYCMGVLPPHDHRRRVARRMSFTTCSAGFLALEDLALIFVPSSLRREPNPP
ncbi:MAG: hypothetical protein ACR2JJ_12305 [Sphingomicrobium sp.]